MDPLIDIPEDIRLEARRRLVDISGRTAAPEELADLKAWLEADPRHAVAYQNAGAVLEDVAEMSRSAEMRALVGADDIFQPSMFERAVAALRNALPGPAPIAAGFATLTLLAAVFLYPFTENNPRFNGDQYATQIAEIRELTLNDGSIVTLGGRSAIEVAFSDNERRVRLSGGEAFFSVANDPSRPFFVVVDDTEIRVVGTKFDVHRGPEAVRVSVLEGVVEVKKIDERGRFPLPRPSPGETQVLTAGDVVKAVQGGVVPVRAEEAAPAGAWRDGRLVYKNATLAEVIADVNRYHGQEIVITSDELKSLRITASFRIEQADKVINIVTFSLPVDAETGGDGKILLKKRGDVG